MFQPIQNYSAVITVMEFFRGWKGRNKERKIRANFPTLLYWLFIQRQIQRMLRTANYRIQDFDLNCRLYHSAHHSCRPEEIMSDWFIWNLFFFLIQSHNQNFAEGSKEVADVSLVKFYKMQSKIVFIRQNAEARFDYDQRSSLHYLEI